MIDSDSYIYVKDCTVTCDTIKAGSYVYFENADINAIQIESTSDISVFNSEVLVANMLGSSGEIYFSESKLTGYSQVYPDFVTSRGTTYFELKQRNGTYSRVNTIQGKTIIFDKSMSDSDHVFLFQDSLTLSKCRIENMDAGYVSSTGFKWHSMQVATNTIMDSSGEVINPSVGYSSSGRITYYAAPEGQTSAIGKTTRNSNTTTKQKTTRNKTKCQSYEQKCFCGACFCYFSFVVEYGMLMPRLSVIRMSGAKSLFRW